MSLSGPIVPEDISIDASNSRETEIFVRGKLFAIVPSGMNILPGNAIGQSIKQLVSRAYNAGLLWKDDPLNWSERFMKNPHIEGRRWYDGFNTYHKVRVYMNGKCTHETKDMIAGGGDQFLDSAYELLEDVFPEYKERHVNGTRKHGSTVYLREVLHGSYSVVDVKRKADL